MKRSQINVRLPERAVEQLRWLTETTGMTKAQIILLAIDRLATSEKRRIQKGRSA